MIDGSYTKCGAKTVNVYVEIRKGETLELKPLMFM